MQFVHLLPPSLVFAKEGRHHATIVVTPIRRFVELMRRGNAAIGRVSPLWSGITRRNRKIILAIVCIAVVATLLWRIASPPRSEEDSREAFRPPVTPVKANNGAPSGQQRAQLGRRREGATSPSLEKMGDSLGAAAADALRRHYLRFPDGFDRAALLVAWGPLLDSARDALRTGTVRNPLPVGSPNPSWITAVHDGDFSLVSLPVKDAAGDRGVLLVVGRNNQEGKEGKEGKSDRCDLSGVFTNDARTDEMVRSLFGPDWFEATAVQHSGSFVGTLASVMFVFDPDRCLYVASEAIPFRRADNDGGSAGDVVVMVDHLFGQWDAFKETREEAHFNYVLRRVPPISVRQGGDGVVQLLAWDTLKGVWRIEAALISALQPAMWHALPTPMSKPRWLSIGQDPIKQYHSSVWKGYWLSYKTIKWDAYNRVPNYQYDFLGRMHFGAQYRWRGEVSRAAGALQTAPDQQQPTSGEDILQLLRNRVIYFFGDSHMRIFFYGLLSHLGLAYPLDKVWRGDRTDYIASHNVTVKFVASYFLNFSRPSATEMMVDGSTPVVVAGVGQHHSCHCWSIAKHMSVVVEALRDLIVADPSSVPAAWHQKRHVVWFGTPAQPYNTHLYRAKPVGQGRRDCRNNARHLLYSAHHMAALQRVIGSVSDVPANPSVAFVDSFYSSFGMQHTSLDGAHYYTWVRESWIEQLAVALRKFAHPN